MTAKEIIALQRARPFPGLRIHVSDGVAYEVTHPEMMSVTRTLVFIALTPGEDGVPEQSAYCDPVHITRIEPINGQRRRSTPKRRKS